MKKKIGNTSFTPTLPARSSASCLRLNAQKIRMSTQRVADAGAKPVGLHQNRDQLLQLRFAGSLGQIPQRFRAPLAGAHFQVDQAQLFAELLVRHLQFAAHVLNRLVESQTSFHRNHHHVERIGQRKPKVSWRFGNLLVQHVAGKEVSP